MKYAALTPLLTATPPSPQVYILYGNRPDVLQWRLFALESLLKLWHPEVESVFVDAPPQGASTLSLFGPATRKLYHIESAIKNASDIEGILGGQDLVIWSAPTLTTKAAPFVQYASHPKVALIGCYDFVLSELEKYIALINTYGVVSFTPEGKAALLRCVEENLEGLHIFLSKVKLLPNKALNEEDIALLYPSLLRDDYDRLCKAFFSGHKVLFLKELAQTHLKTESFMGLCRSFLSAFKALHRAFLDVHKGMSCNAAIAQQRYPLFFGREEMLSSCLRQMSHVDMTLIFERLLMLERHIKGLMPRPCALEQDLLELHHMLFKEKR